MSVNYFTMTLVISIGPAVTSECRIQSQFSLRSFAERCFRFLDRTLFSMIPGDLGDHSFSSVGVDDEDLPSVAEYKVRNSTMVKRLTADEDEDEAPAHFHDQLPSIEELKAASSFGVRQVRRSKLGLYVGIGVIFAAVFIAVGVSLSSNDSKAAPVTIQQTQPQPDQPLQATQSPDITIPKDPEGERPNRSRVHEYADFIVDHHWSKQDVISEPQSPQWKAAVWLADFDLTHSEPEDTMAFRQRYGLAVFFFALGGREWVYDVGFLDEGHVCDWNERFDTVGLNEGVQVGVDCSCSAIEPDCDPQTVKSIYLPKLGLTGSIPDEIGLITDLRKLDLYDNRVSGGLARGMERLDNLESLILYRNNLEGNIPGWLLATLPKLETVNFAKNQLTGDFPSLMQNSSLVNLNLEDNSFKFDIQDIGPQPKLKALFLDKNDVFGKLTEDVLESMKELEVLDLSENKIKGDLPSNLFDSSKLIVLDLHGNEFTGPIPDVRNATYLELLALHKNQLSGPIPLSMGNHPYLRHLDLSSNRLTGDIPLALATLLGLEYLFLAKNPFNPGPIPDWISHMKGLVDVSLQDTNRNGTIPVVLGHLTNLVMLDLARNNLEGEIPAELTGCESLRVLVLNRNNLNGELPITFHYLRNLVSLVLDHNDLTENADIMCTLGIDEYITDCAERSDGTKEIDCPCCSNCCQDGDETCNPEVYYGNVDPTWEDKYVRKYYRLHEDDEFFPVTEDDEDEDVEGVDEDAFGGGNDSDGGLDEDGMIVEDLNSEGPSGMIPAEGVGMGPIGDDFDGDVR